MPAKRLAWLAAIGLLNVVALIAPSRSQPAPSAEPATNPPARKLLYPATLRDVSPAIKPHVERLLAADQKPVEPAAAKVNGVFLRILSRRHALDEGKLKP